MEEFPTIKTNPEEANAEVLIAEQDNREQSQRLGSLGNEMMLKSEVEPKSPEEREVEDLEVLFSFCDKEDVLKILKSDSYGTLLQNNVSLLDLFNANVLFDEQYGSDGYTLDYGPRHYGDKLGNQIIGNKQENIEMRSNYFRSNGDYETADRILVADKIRANEAKQTIGYIDLFYFDEEYADEAKTTQFLEAVKTRADGKDLSDEQKEFLREEHNLVADRLLYDGKVTNEERANRILKSLNDCEEKYNNDKLSEDEYNRGLADRHLVERFVYAEASINDYMEAGKPELVYGATQKLEELVDKHFEKIMDCANSDGIDYINYDYRGPELILNYSNPFKLIERAKKYKLTQYVDRRKLIIRPDQIVETVAAAHEGYGADPTMDISENAKALKELGASDKAILENCHNLRPSDFISAKDHYCGSGSRLVEAGIDRAKIIREVFSSVADHQGRSPFEKNGYPVEDGKSYVDILESNGFNITDIAKTFSPDAISSNLSEFINRGADAKELMKYMMNYHEISEDKKPRLNVGMPTSTELLNAEYKEAMREYNNSYHQTRVIDAANGREFNVKKYPEKYPGHFYVFANLEKFSNESIPAKDIIEEMRPQDCSPVCSPAMSKLLECYGLQVLDQCYAKYTSEFLASAEPTMSKEEYAKFALEDVLKNREAYNKHYKEILEDKNSK